MVLDADSILHKPKEDLVVKEMEVQDEDLNETGFSAILKQRANPCRS